MKDNDSINSTIQGTESYISLERRRRINQIKKIIIIVAIILLLLPTIICIILAFKVINLEAKLDKLSLTMNSKEDMIIDESNGYDYSLETDYNEAQISNNNNYHQQLVQYYLKDNKVIYGLNITSATNYIPQSYKEFISSLQKSMYIISNQGFLLNFNDSIKVIDDSKDNSIDNSIGGLIDNSIGDSISDALNGTDTITNNTANNTVDNTTGNISEHNDSIDSSSVNDINVEDQADGFGSEPVGKYYGKKVYLTFDDGPSKCTDEILDILSDYNVKATFFVIGQTDKEALRLYKRIVDEGHTLGMHSYSHDYKIIYKSVEDFDKDFTKLWKLLYDTTGYKPTIYRFPGGSSNLAHRSCKDDIIRYLNNKDIKYFDWNALNGDATGVKYTNDQLINNVLEGVAVKKRAFVLMHDTQSKKATVETLPIILDKLLSEGAEILPIDDSVTPIQSVKAIVE